MILLTFIKAFELLFEILEIAIIIDVVLSWTPIQENAVTELVHTISRPFLYPGRIIQEKLIPGLAVDFSPILAIIIINILKKVVFLVIYPILM